MNFVLPSFVCLIKRKPQTPKSAETVLTVPNQVSVEGEPISFIIPNLPKISNVKNTAGTAPYIIAEAILLLLVISLTKIRPAMRRIAQTTFKTV